VLYNIFLHIEKFALKRFMKNSKKKRIGML
jgi:hypothetical protein